MRRLACQNQENGDQATGVSPVGENLKPDAASSIIPSPLKKCEITALWPVRSSQVTAGINY
jgi:hypothetical protein